MAKRCRGNLLLYLFQYFEFVVWQRLAKKYTKERSAGLLVLIKPIELLISGVFVALLAVISENLRLDRKGSLTSLVNESKMALPVTAGNN